ncbi:glycerophosphodiester phosphodiesterase [Virgibacillus sp. 179-BFC.A HS]|uniref:Glycerophosphodiester phosphodiesterase n=1 Tax=Tigheibacillus jepli TaxID=3035914 RepID=A0ABU5CJ39_9BACI|nr:glycerophosphodiester phosphodiesterase [Virgibacillus sp. 179-BFC.A HS]MDY0406372.1 glycerophosphodiester phosphodiesterase [Virgibacillus sp. 179-BFC.A HS]
MYMMAHRGISGHRPENTMASFREAVKQKVDCIELDVRLTKDGVPVVCHDATIRRTSNGKGFIHQLTLKELKKYDFGSWFSEEYKGERIPTFEEVLELVKDESINLNIETKNGPVIPEDLEAKTLDLVYRYHMQERVMYSSFDHFSLKRLYKLDSSAKVGFVFHMNLINLFDYIENTGVPTFSIHPNHFYITDEMIQEAHKRGIKVNAYTVNNRGWADKYRHMGVDGLITNYPAEMK